MSPIEVLKPAVEAAGDPRPGMWVPGRGEGAKNRVEATDGGRQVGLEGAAAPKIGVVARKERDRANWLQRRNEVVDQAAHLFAARGYHATGVAELGEKVGLARGALYYYIESKDTLLALIHDRVITEVLSAGDAANKMDASPVERLQFLGKELVRIITDYPDHVWVFLHEFRHLEGEAATNFRIQRRKFEEHIETILVAGRESGDFKIDDTRLAALAWLGLHNYIYIWHHKGSPFTAEIIAEQFGNMFLDGIRSQ